MNAYSRLIAEEEAYREQIRAAEWSQKTILDYISCHHDGLDKLTCEEILLSLYQLEIDARNELLHLRFAKTWQFQPYNVSDRWE